MRIGFVLGVIPIQPTYDFGEITKFTREGLSGFSLEDYWRVKGLEVNKEFETAILLARKNLGLPINGLPYSEYTRYFYNYENNDFFTSSNKLEKLIPEDLINKEIQKMLSRHDCDSFVKWQLKSILLAEVVLPSYPNMSNFGEISIQTLFSEDDLNIDDYTNNEKAILIKITSKVSPEAIREFVKDRHDIFVKLLKELPKKKKFELSNEKLNVYELGNKNLSYKAIADKLVDGTDYEPKAPKAIEKIYKRTLLNIESLFHKKSDK